MPTVWFERGFRFSFFSQEGTEPAHVHVEKGGAVGKWWLESLTPAFYHGFSPGDLRTVARLLGDHQAYLLEQWHEFFEL
jgi:hypothetical protein